MDNFVKSMSAFEGDDDLDLRQELNKYLRYWPWFVAVMIIALISAYTYLRYTPKIYQTTTKIKILDESDGLELPTSGFVFNRSNINLENEIEILNSFRIVEQVVRDLKLNTSFFEEGQIQTTQRANLPFVFEQLISVDSIMASTRYEVFITKTGFEVINLETDFFIEIPKYDSYLLQHKLPFEIAINDKSSQEELQGKTFIISFSTLKQTVMSLKAKLEIEAIGEQSDLLKITLKGESQIWSEDVLDRLVQAFNKDGINDRQLVSRRTLKFIDERFIYLAEELDSIEINKKDFKKDNNLVFLPDDAALGLAQRSKAEEELFKNENQLALAKLIQNALSSSDHKELLPSNIGIESGGINSLIIEYNTSILERDKYSSSGGQNNPLVKRLDATITNLKRNINKSLQSYINQINVSLSQLENRTLKLGGEVSRLPEKEKLLRAIDRQQKIKESLYLLLLQKREEAAINLVITEDTVKIVEYALSGSNPISPKNKIVYAGALMVGLLIPFGVLYLMFILDTKVHNKKDVETIVTNVPIVGEIPLVKKKEQQIFENPNDHSMLAESFRILSSNVKYVLPLKKNGGNVIFCTSTVKGEGKTYVSINLSLALSSLNKKVLLIGADLRNPQIHTYIDKDKNGLGLSSYLHETDSDWQSLLIKGFMNHDTHDVLLSGAIPPNPSHLLANDRFEKLINEAKERYDYIIVDTTPTILVTDTMLNSSLADATLYIVRANYTEKELLEFSKELHTTGKLKNMSYVINGVGANKSKGYGYNYGYGYGYGNGANS